MATQMDKNFHKELTTDRHYRKVDEGIYASTSGQYYTIDNNDVVMRYDDLQAFETETGRDLDDESEKKANADAAAEIAKAVEASTSSIADRMKPFKATLEAVNQKFNYGHAVYTQYLLFTLNKNLDTTDRNQVLVDTTSLEWTENCLTQFQLKLNGSGQANQFTLTIVLLPNDRNTQNIMAIEEKLLDAISITVKNDNTTLKEMNNIFVSCSFKYGYGDEPDKKDLRSPVYTGMITGYTCNLDQGNLVYTINGVTGLYAAKEIRLSNKDEYLKGAVSNGNLKPFEYLKNIFKIEFEDSPKYKSKDGKPLYELVFLDNAFSDNGGASPESVGMDLAKFEQKNIFDIITDLLNASVSNKEKAVIAGTAGKIISPTQKQCYDYYVDTSTEALKRSTAGAVTIYKLPSTSSLNDQDDETKPHQEITFNWFAPSKVGFNCLVKSWKPEVDGMIALSLASSLQSQGSWDNSLVHETMDDDGNVVKQVSTGGTRLGVKDKTQMYTYNTIQDFSQIAKGYNYSMKATLALQGCPCDVPLTGRIGVNAIMGSNQIHPSSGTYAILSKTDVLSPSGFTSTFELMKIAKVFDPTPTDGALKDTPSNSDIASAITDNPTLNTDDKKVIESTNQGADYNSATLGSDETNTAFFQLKVKQLVKQYPDEYLSKLDANEYAYLTGQLTEEERATFLKSCGVKEDDVDKDNSKRSVG